jgi:hypothetical protein
VRAVRVLLPALGVACALAGCDRRPAPPDADASAGAVPTAAPPADAAPPPPDAAHGWTPEALEQARALTRKFAAETHPCFYAEVVLRGYPSVSALSHGGGSEGKPGGPVYVVFPSEVNAAEDRRFEDALELRFHEVFPPERFGAPAEKTFMELRGGAYADGQKLREALGPCLDRTPKPLRFAFQLDATGALDPKTVQGPDPAGNACVRRVMPKLAFKCLARFWVQSDSGLPPF